ncbi:MAG: FimB/Mfa2 family fimbrial subunit [Muribaculaceae bacterium]|nr:FimB/Mfa2 family fimbrial subunit [Muribaculaceae bacterium]
MRLTFSNIITSSVLLLSGMGIASCSMMEEDLSDCPTGLYVRFIYDYNTQRADMFKDHVGHVEVLVFDESKRLVASRSISNTKEYAPLAEYGYTVHFTPEEVPGGRNYRIQVIGMQRNFEEAHATPGAKYRYAGDHRAHSEALSVALDHSENTIDGTDHFAVSDIAPLDTLWHTLKVITTDPTDGDFVPPMPRTQLPYAIYGEDGLKETGGEYNVRVEANKATYATVSLIRDTKHLGIGLHQTDPEYKKDMSGDRFDVRIVDKNCTVAHDNEVLKDHTVRYTPYAAWTMMMDSDGITGVETIHKGNLTHTGVNATRDGETDEDKVVERVPYYNIMFNRMMLNGSDNSDNGVLEITDKETGKTVAKVNLPHYLSLGRDAYALQNYSHQEYLDREYNYNLDFFLSGSKWIAVEIRVLSWSKRIQIEEL